MIVLFCLSCMSKPVYNSIISSKQEPIENFPLKKNLLLSNNISDKFLRFSPESIFESKRDKFIYCLLIVPTKSEK